MGGPAATCAGLFGLPRGSGQTPLRHMPKLEQTLFDYYYRGDYDEFWQRKDATTSRVTSTACRRPGRHIRAAGIDASRLATTEYFAAMAAQNSRRSG